MKNLREISIDGCERIGVGSSGAVYRIEPDAIVKVFYPGVGLDRIENERKHARTAFVNGINTAIPFDTVRVGDCYGTVYEWIDAVSLAETIRRNPEQAGEYRIKYAKMLRSIHRIPMSDVFQDIKALHKTWAGGLAEYLTESEIRSLLDLIEEIPERDTFVHCDCHVGNVMVRDGELVLIDMADVGRGHPLFDIGAEYYHYKLMPVLYDRERMLEILLGFVPEQEDFTDRIWDDLVKYYFEPTDESEYREIEMIATAMGSLRSLMVIAKQAQAPEAYKQAIVKRARREFFPRIDEYMSVLKSIDRYFSSK